MILAIACFFLWRANKASQVEPDEVVSARSFEREPEAVERMNLLAEIDHRLGRAARGRSRSRRWPGWRSPPCSAWASCPRCARRTPAARPRSRLNAVTVISVMLVAAALVMGIYFITDK